MTAIYRALRLEEREECLNLWTTVWPGDNSRAYFERYFYGDVEWLPYYTQVTECDGRLVSAVHICKRVVSCGDFSLIMGGIANVATLPEYRGRGYNTACMTNAIEVMEADAMDFSLLFTGINSYYRKLGFSDLPRLRTTALVTSDYLPKPKQYSIRRAVGSDMPAIRRIYDGYNESRPIAVRRSEAYWRDWMRFDPDNPPAELSVAVTESEDIAGYVFLGVFNSAVPYGSDDSEARIIELCTNHSSEDEEVEIARTLLHDVISTLPPTGQRKLVLEIAFTPVIAGVVLEAAGEYGFEQSQINSGMVRLLHRDNLLKSIAMCSYEQWADAQSPAGTLIFETPYGPSKMEGLQSHKFDASSSEAKATQQISQSDLFRMLFGSSTPQQVTDKKDLYPLLRAMFPRREEMVYWGVDGF